MIRLKLKCIEGKQINPAPDLYESIPENDPKMKIKLA